MERPKLGVMTFRKIRGNCVLLNGQWSMVKALSPLTLPVSSPFAFGNRVRGVCGCGSQAPTRIPAALRAERKDHVTESVLP